MTTSLPTVNALPAFWVNGERLPAGGPHVSAADRGLTLADGVFETLRAWGGVVFRLERHLERLSEALITLDLPAPPGIRGQILNAVRSVNAGDAAVRVVVTRGIGSGVMPPAAADARPTLIVSVAALPIFPPAIYQAGLTAHVASGRRNERAMTAGLKTLAYTDAVAALAEARRAGADEALFLDTEDHCSEASSSNLFAWTGSVLVTPPLTCGALPGITRATVLELAREIGIAAEERALALDELTGAQEAFLTSSLRGLAPLVRLGAAALGRGVPGALTRQLAAAYTALVARECGSEIPG